MINLIGELFLKYTLKLNLIPATPFKKVGMTMFTAFKFEVLKTELFAILDS